MKRHFTVRSAAVLVCTLAVASTAWANGEAFFMPAPSDRPVDLVYAGRIRDSETGRLLQGVSITITDKHSGMMFPLENNAPGHYRTPDLGASIKDLAGTKVDPKDLQFDVEVTGYKPLTVTKLPRKTNGIVELNFKMQPVSSNSSGAPLEDSSSGSSGGWIWLALGGAIAVTGVAARTFVRGQSTAR